MIHTAEEILQGQFAFYTHLMISEKRGIIAAINEARIEAIKECSEKAFVSLEPCGDPKICGCMGNCEHPYAYVNKDSILKLIEYIK